jgi:LssY C-terminus
LRWLKLLIQRTLVLALGVVTVWLIAFVIFDAADRRLPLVLAVGLTYGLAAYVVLPRAIRMGLRILHRERVPSYTITGDGLPGDPVNLALIGTVCQLRRAFAESGWFEADALSLASSWRMVRAFILNQPYPKAPFSTLYLFGRGQDVGFQQPIGDSPRKRNHVRFWGLPLERAAQTIDTPSFWFESPHPTSDERALWVGAATKDIGFSLTRLSFQITHATGADTDEERNFIIGELQRHDVIVNIRSHLPGERLSIGKINRYVTDGAVAVAELGALSPRASRG